ncbi:septum site-determining protein MinC [Proteocatella sphenisci]|uniref:septum site-determining protein MinC n=1 Tax=Proteocatella sphenisci TaxID=181070 RepID=UPI0006881CCC|nr:septum site-determining protein MinC [Proteocatella sphenisci]
MELEIKGTKSGFIVNIAESIDFINARKLLLDKFEESNEFFKGSKFIKFNAPGLKNSDINYLKSLLEESYDIIFEEEDVVEEIQSNTVQSGHIDSSNVNVLRDKMTSIDETINRIKNLTKTNVTEVKKEESESMALPTKFLFENLRSGAEIEYDGNVVIFGDVNPGAKITATGNIVVLGSFRGMAHAGKGNIDCFLAALKLLPLQIRIEDMFAVPPEDATMLTNALVKNKDGEIVIENF